MPRISLVVQISENRVIGKDNDLIWHIPEDLKRFRELTTGHPIIMGRKTYDSIGKPLPNRTNIVITQQEGFEIPGCTVVYSLGEALVKAREIDQSEIFIIGGGQIYEQSIGIADRLYITVVHTQAVGDTYFPEYSQFTKEVGREEGVTEGEIPYTRLTLEK